MKTTQLSRLRAEAAGYDGFVADFHNPLSHISMSLRFDQIHVNLSASPYICLKNEYSQICISHISRVKRREQENAGISYVLTCLDYTQSDEPAENLIELKFFKSAS